MVQLDTPCRRDQSPTGCPRCSSTRCLGTLGRATTRRRQSSPRRLARRARAARPTRWSGRVPAVLQRPPAAPAKPAVQPPKQAGAISGLNGRATGGTAGAGASGAAVRASAKPAGARPGGGLDFLARLEAVEKAEEAGMNGGAAAAPAGDSAALTVEVPTDANGASGPAGASTLTGGAKPSASDAKPATKAADRQASKSKSSSVAREKSNGVSREKSNSGSAATAAPGRRFSASSGRGAAAAAAAAAAAGGRGGAAGRGGRGAQCRGRSQVEASCHAHALVCALPPLPFG